MIGKDVAIDVENLKKFYGSTEALKGISFTVKDKEILAFLGPNGAGKTTAINILTGLTTADNGEVKYYGKLFTNDDLEIKKIIGVVPQHNNLDRDLTVVENLKIHGVLFGMSSSLITRRIDELLEITELTAHKNKKASDLSGGMKRKLVIARALLHEPKILFLDEPSAGLDPVTRRNIHNLILKLNSKQGVTIFLTTHYIEEAEYLASKVVFIDLGKIATEGTPRELIDGIGNCAVEFRDGNSFEIRYYANRDEAIHDMKNDTRNMRVRDVTLEDVFFKITGKKME